MLAGARYGLTGPLPHLGPIPPPPDFMAISHFRFEDVAVVDGSRWRVVTAPIYRAFWPDGLQLSYHCTAWQTGQAFEYHWKEAA